MGRPRPVSPLPPAFPVRDGRQPAQQWMYDTIRHAILDRQLPSGAGLPSTRVLAAAYKMARGTVVAAFDQLRAEGYIETHRGAAARVCRVLPDDLLQAQHVARPEPRIHPARQLSHFGRHVQAFPPASSGRPRAFRANVPALDLFPVAQWAQVAGRRLRRVNRSLLSDAPAEGYMPLRRAIANYLVASRGVRCETSQVIVLSGTQEALDLTTRVFLDRGDGVCVEDPGYVGARRLFMSVGARVIRLSVDAEGARLPSLRTHARLAYLTPAHQFPTGVSMSLARRLAFIEWARRAGAMIFEDDYDSEYRYAARPVPALQGLDAHGVVLVAGTFSKVLFPSLRLAYLVVPPDLVDRFSAAKSISSRHAPAVEQAVLTDFIEGGYFSRHLRRMRQVYAERLVSLQAAARQYADGLLDLSAIDAGLQTSAWLAGNPTGADVAAAASGAGLEVVDLAKYSSRTPTREGLLLGFAAIDPSDIRRGMQVLGEVIRQCQRS